MSYRTFVEVNLNERSRLKDTLKRKQRRRVRRKKRKMQEKEQVPLEEEKIKINLCFKTKASDPIQYPCEIKCSSSFA
jgi:hypothetical protein